MSRLALAAIYLICSWMTLGAGIEGKRYYTQIKSFGFANQSGALPFGELLLASDGYIYGLVDDGLSIFRVSTDGTDYRIVARLQSAGAFDAARSGLIEGSDGRLYGAGVKSVIGLVYALEKDGSNYHIIHEIGESATKPTEGSDGKLYGSTQHGGGRNLGTLYSMNRDGRDYQILHEFGTEADGAIPSMLIELPDGTLTGTTEGGGRNGGGTIFRINRDGGGYAILKEFGEEALGPIQPGGGLLNASDGKLYGMTLEGGRLFGGTAFRLRPDGGDFEVIQEFDSLVENQGFGRLVEGPEGWLAGITKGGTATFKMTKDGVLIEEQPIDAPQGEEYTRASGPLMLGKNGALFGVAGGGDSRAGVLYKMEEDAQPAILRSFSASGGDGRLPSTRLVSSRDGLLYGACSKGGQFDNGMLFKMDGRGENYQILYSFPRLGVAGNTCALVDGMDGVLYGVTKSNGTFENENAAVIKIQKNGGKAEILYSFTNGVPDSLIQGSDGKLYGTLGCTGWEPANCGAIYRLETDGTGFFVLKSFAERVRWISELTEGTDHKFYGAVGFAEGTNTAQIFRIGDGGGYETVKSLQSGYFSPFRLLEASDGMLYGLSGNNAHTDLIYRLNKDGTDFREVFIFQNQGVIAKGPLWEGPDGMLYGMGFTDLYRVSKEGTNFQVLRTFYGDGLGTGPVYGLVQKEDGTVYGLTSGGGVLEGGTLFRLGDSMGEPKISISLQENGDVKLKVAGPAGTRVKLQSANSLYPNSWFTIGGYYCTSEGSLSAFSPANSKFFRLELDEF